MIPTLTPTEADRHLDSALWRMNAAASERDSFAHVIGKRVVMGRQPSGELIRDWMIARAAELEARADWDDARRLRAKVRNGAQMDSWQGRWVA